LEEAKLLQHSYCHS